MIAGDQSEEGIDGYGGKDFEKRKDFKTRVENGTR